MKILLKKKNKCSLCGHTLNCRALKKYMEITRETNIRCVVEEYNKLILLKNRWITAIKNLSSHHYLHKKFAAIIYNHIKNIYIIFPLWLFGMIIKKLVLLGNK